MSTNFLLIPCVFVYLIISTYNAYHKEPLQSNSLFSDEHITSELANRYPNDFDSSIYQQAMILSTRRPRPIKPILKTGKHHHLIYLSLIIILQSADCELNPGPSTRHISTSKGLEGAKKDNPDFNISDVMNAIQESNVKLTESLNNIKTELADVKEQMNQCQCKHVIDGMDEIKRENTQLKERVNKLENYTKRKNLLMMNMPENADEKQNDTEELVRKYLCDTLKIENATQDETFPIEKAFRLGKKKNLTGKPRPVLIEFGRQKHKEQSLQNYRKVKKTQSGDSVILKEDFCEAVREIRKKLYPYLQKANEINDSDQKNFMRGDTITISGRSFTYDLNNQNIIARDSEPLPGWMNEEA